MDKLKEGNGPLPKAMARAFEQMQRQKDEPLPPPTEDKEWN